METRNSCQLVREHSLRPEPAWRDTRFTITEARRALPYVERVVRDASWALTIIQDCRIRIEIESSALERDYLCQRRDEMLRRLNETIDECHAVGVSYVDIVCGLVAFRSHFEHRDLSLTWRIGEPIESAWEDLLEVSVV